MNLKRGHLILSGMLVSFGLAILVHKMIEAKASKHSSTSASDSTALNATSQSNGSGGTNQLPARGDVRIGVISDLNSQYGSTSYEPEVTKAIALIPCWRTDIVLSGDDMVAGQSPTLSTEEIKAMWTAFDHHVGAPLRKAHLPFGFTIGNHDASAAISSVSGKFLFSNVGIILNTLRDCSLWIEQSFPSTTVFRKIIFSTLYGMPQPQNFPLNS